MHSRQSERTISDAQSMRLAQVDHRHDELNSSAPSMEPIRITANADVGPRR